MQNPILDSLTLVDVSGHVIIAAIVLSLALGIVANFAIRARYASMERDLLRNPTASAPFSHAVLERIVRQARQALGQNRAALNTQAIIEQNFQSELKLLLIGERFVRASIGLMIILGLIGTFYGLTLSIGKLVRLISDDAPGGADVAQAITQGLRQALAGMSVAFTTSLFGILAAIVMMLLGIFSNLTDRRTALMVQIETYVDQLLPSAADLTGLDPAALARGANPEYFERSIAGFGQSVARLEDAVTRFDAALQSFATTTRDFREFNLHLKDNVQRMSLSFGDFSEAMKTQVGALRSRDGS